MPFTDGVGAAEVAAGLAMEPDPPVDAAELRRVVVPRAGVDVGAGLGAGAGVATGFTSTVLLAAAVLRVVRRRGVGEGQKAHLRTETFPMI